MKRTTNQHVDVHVGLRIRSRRMLLGMTQEQLAAAAGVSFQMIQKYEKGARIGGSRLDLLARALGVPVAFFFPETEARVAEEQAQMDDDVLSRKETIELLKAYYALPENTRKTMLDMLKGLQEKPEGK